MILHIKLCNNTNTVRHEQPYFVDEHRFRFESNLRSRNPLGLNKFSDGTQKNANSPYSLLNQ